MRIATTALALVSLTTFATAQTGLLVDTTLDELYLVDTSTGAATFLASVANNGLSTAADLTYRAATNELWTIDLAGGEIGTIDIGSGTFTPWFLTNVSGWQGMAWDETTQLFFLANQNGTNYSFDATTNTLTALGPAGSGLIGALDTDANGTLYGIDFTGGNVLTIDKTTGAATAVSTAMPGMQGLGIDQTTGQFYASSTGTDSLYSVDAATGATNLIGPHGGNITFAKGFDLIDGTAVSIAQNISYGAGCGNLTLAGLTRPILGTNWDMGLTSTPASGTLGVLIMDLVPLSIDLTPIGAPGCTLLNATSASVVLPFPIPATAFQFPIPNNTMFLGLDLYAQIAQIAPTENTLGIVFSNGLQGIVGDF